MRDKSGRVKRELLQTAAVAVVGAAVGSGGAATKPAARNIVPEPRKEAAAAEKTPSHDCDRLAADPQDPNRVAAGVEFYALRAEEAILACSAALAMTSSGGRFEFQLGRALHKAKAYRAALDYYRLSANQGYSPAMFNIALLYLNGQGVARDSEREMRWMHAAADNGNLRAMSVLAVNYNWGLGVDRDPEMAAKSMFRALSNGYDTARREMTKNSGSWGKRFRRTLQRMLAQAGLYSGKIDGLFGPTTFRAIRSLSTE